MARKVRTDTRHNVVSTRLNDDEAAALEDGMESTGLTQTDFIRDALAEKSERAKVAA